MLLDARCGISRRRRADAAESAVHVFDGDRAQTMMRAKTDFTSSSILRAAAAVGIALWLGSMPGCASMNGGSNSSSSEGTETVPVSPEAAAVANTLSHQPDYDKDEDKTLKCEQLVRNPPGIE